MAFNPSVPNSLAANTDVALSSVANQQVVTYDGPSSKWLNRAMTGGGSATPGRVYFDEYFTGATDSAKITAMNNWAQAQAGAGPAVVFGTRQYDFNVPIKLFSGLKLLGGSMSAAREFSRNTILNWQGGSGSSMFIFPLEGQTNQTYPNDDSPRDITVAYMQLQGGSSTHCLPQLNPTSASATDRTLYNSQFHCCGFKNFSTVWWGWGQGSSISGQTHMQSIGQTGLFLGGSENRIFGTDAYSFAGNSTTSQTQTFFMRSVMSRSTIGNCMVTARKDSSVLSVEGGSNLTIDGMAFDAQSSDPIYGAGLVISGGSAITITSCSFKGMATNPSSGVGGANSNKGWIHVSGGNQISLVGNNFRREGNNMPSTSYPLLYAGSAVPAGAIKWGFNGYSSYSGSPAVIKQAASGKISYTPDTSLTVTVGA